VTNILGSKGLGADVVFLVGFDQGKLPAKKDVQEDEVYQFLVALTRTKKRLYLITTQSKNGTPSSFLECIEAKYLNRVT
jgi:superfamily I DNA/RNA helicase